MMEKGVGTELGVFELMNEKDSVKRLFVGMILDHEFIIETMRNHYDEINCLEVARLKDSSLEDPFNFTTWSKEVGLGYMCMKVLLNWISREGIKTVDFENFSEKAKYLFASNKSSVLRYFELVQHEYSSKRVVSRNLKWSYWFEQIKNTEFN